MVSSKALCIMGSLLPSSCLSAADKNPPNSYRLLGANEIEIPAEETPATTFWKQVRFYGVETYLGPYLEQLERPILTFQAVPETLPETTTSAPLRLFFTGKYGADLLDEVYRYAYAVSFLAQREEFDPHSCP
jgi:hypothetical protein